MSVLAGLMEAPIRKKPRVPSGHHHGPKPLHEMFSTFRSSHPSPKVCLPPINNQESMTSQLPDKAVPHHISAQANGFYFCIFGENHVSAFDNTNKGGKKKKPQNSDLHSPSTFCSGRPQTNARQPHLLVTCWHLGSSYVKRPARVLTCRSLLSER